MIENRIKELMGTLEHGELVCLDSGCDIISTDDLCDGCLAKIGERFKSRTYQLVKINDSFFCVHVCKSCGYKEQIPAKGM